MLCINFDSAIVISTKHFLFSLHSLALSSLFTPPFSLSSRSASKNKVTKQKEKKKYEKRRKVWLERKKAFFFLLYFSSFSLESPFFFSSPNKFLKNTQIFFFASSPTISRILRFVSRMSRARVYADVNVHRPREYWDYDNLTINWGSDTPFFFI